MVGEHRFQYPLHVGIASVHLIHNQHFTEQTKKAQALMLAGEYRQQCLVDGAHTGRRKQRTLAVLRQPDGATSARRFVQLVTIRFRVDGRQD